MLFVSQPGSDHFAQPYLKEWPTSVESCLTTNEVLVRRQMRHHDFVWIEWGNTLCDRILDKGPHPTGGKIMVRIHDYEIRTGLVDYIHWQNADALWFVNPQSMSDFRGRIISNDNGWKLDGLRMFVVPNAVTIGDFRIVADPKSKKLAMLSVNFQSRKRYDRAVMLLSLLPDTYTLHIRASMEHREAGRCYDLCTVLARKFGIHDRLFIDTGHVVDAEDLTEKQDIIDFFRGKSHVLSTSNHEGHHLTIAEGMLCGLQPIVFDWEWGQASYFWNPYVYTSVGAMAEAIQRVELSPMKARDHVRRRFGTTVMMRRLMQHVKKIQSAKSKPAR